MPFFDTAQINHFAELQRGYRSSLREGMIVRPDRVILIFFRVWQLSPAWSLLNLNFDMIVLANLATFVRDSFSTLKIALKHSSAGSVLQYRGISEFRSFFFFWGGGQCSWNRSLPLDSGLSPESSQASTWLWAPAFCRTRTRTKQAKGVSGVLEEWVWTGYELQLSVGHELELSKQKVSLGCLKNGCELVMSSSFLLDTN